MQAFGSGTRDELLEHGAKEEEVLMGDLIVRMCNCGHEEFLKELLVRPKIKRPGKLTIPLILMLRDKLHSFVWRDYALLFEYL